MLKKTKGIKIEHRSEYRIIASAIAEIMWIKSLLSELQIKSSNKLTLWCDNQSLISLTANPVLHSRTIHMEIDLYVVREQVINRNLKVSYIPSTYQKADILTKPLSWPNFIRFGRENVDETDIKFRSDAPIYIPEAIQDEKETRQSFIS